MARTILMVGGSSGIGLATAQLLKSRGDEVIAATRHPERLTSIGIAAQKYDVLSPTPLELPEVLDGFIYCPGTINLKPFHRLSEQDFLQDYRVNFLGAVETLQAALPALKNSHSASVVLFSTVAVAQGMPFHASISAAKAAVEGLTRSLAAELAPKIRVNAIAPSLTDTPLADTFLNSEVKREAAAKRHPLQQVGNSHDVAQLAAFLLSDAAKFLTGQILRPDGGLSSVRLFG